MDHEVLLAILGENIHDQRFLRLVRHLLESGYLEEWRFNTTLSGSPQGGVVSPILSNIYLDKLDQFVEQKLLPAYTRGAVRKHNNRYVALVGQAATSRKRGDHKKARALLNEARKLPAMDTHDA